MLRSAALALAAVIPLAHAQGGDEPAWEPYSPVTGTVDAAIHFDGVTYVNVSTDFYFRADTAAAWTEYDSFPVPCPFCRADRYAIGPDPTGANRLYAGRQNGGAVYGVPAPPLEAEEMIADGGDVVAPLRADLLVVGGRNGFEDSFPGDPAAGSYGVAVSRDGGQSWHGSTVNPPEVDSFGDAVSFAVLGAESQAPGRLLAGVYNGLAYSDDYGHTWEQVGAWFVPFRLVGEAMAYDSTGGPAGSGAGAGTAYAAVTDAAEGGFHVLASRDGATWEERAHVREGESSRSRALLALPGGRLVAAVFFNDAEPGFLGEVLTSTDGGRTWAAYGTGYPEGPGSDPRTGGLTRGSDGRLYAATGQRGVWRTAAPVTPPIPIAAEEPSADAGETGDALGLPTPNPATGGVTVPLALARAARVEVEVLDLLGRRVGVLHRGVLAAGRHELAFDGAGVPPGLYVVRAQVGDQVLPVRRFTVVR